MPPPTNNFIQGRDIHEIRVLKRNGFFGITLPVTVIIPGSDAASSVQYTTPFFIANREYEIVNVVERHEAPGNNPGAVTLDVVKVPSGTATAAGTTVLATTFDLKSTADTNVTGSLTATLANRLLAAGDSIALLTSGTLTAVMGVTVSVLLKAI